MLEKDCILLSLEIFKFYMKREKKLSDLLKILKIHKIIINHRTKQNFSSFQKTKNVKNKIRMQNKKEYIALNQENKGVLLNPNVGTSNKSATLEINERSIALQKEGKKIYRYGLGQSPFPVPEEVVKCLSMHAHQKDYLAVKGLQQLRNEIAGWLNRSEKGEFEGDDILIGPGSKQLIFLIGLTLNCDLIIATPCWVSYIPQVKFLGKQVQVIHTKYENRWRLTPEELDEALSKNLQNHEKHEIRNKFMILTYPDNPTGLTYSSTELEGLATVARKHNLIVVSDQIYGKVDFDGKHCSLQRYYPEGTIISTGISKWVGAGGWRLGLFAFPRQLRWLLNTMGNIASETFTSVSAPIQFASCRAFEEGEKIEQYLKGQRQILKMLSQWVYDKVKNQANLLTHQPEGGFYIFLDFAHHQEKLEKRGITTSKKLADALLEETGIAILPGSVFGRVPEELTIRLSYVNFDGGVALEAFNEGVTVDENFLKKYCSDTIEGIQVLVEWTNKE